LDLFPSAAAAYSLRKLRTAYTGSAIQVRRSSDNATQNIGFDSSGNLDTAALSSFVGAGNGTVSIWYDQSGNNLNLSQPVTSSQPSIISNGVIERSGQIITTKFDGVNDFFDGTVISNYITNTTYSFFGVASIVNITTNANNASIYDNDSFWSDSGGYTGIYFKNSPNSAAIQNFSGGNNIIAYNINLSTNYIFFVEHFNNVMYSSINNNVVSSLNSGATSNVASNLKVGRQYSTIYTEINISEMIFWKSSQINNKINIQSNINSYYQIY
jgi:hypothetical protein